VLLTFASASCTSEPQLASAIDAIETYQYCDDKSGLCFDVALPPDLGTACPQEVMVGRMDQHGACPPANTSATGSWQERKIFATPIDGSPVPSKLDGFCTYQWNPSIPETPPDPALLPTDGTRSTWLAPDCRVIAAHGHPFLELAWPSME